MPGKEHNTQTLLDRIDARRFDALAILERLNDFDELEVEAQDAEEFGRWGFAGLDDAEHPLRSLCTESGNDYSVVRHLDGTLAFLFETGIGGGQWQIGRFNRGLISDLELEPYLDHEDSPKDFDLPLTRTELIALLDDLPGYDAPEVRLG